MERKTKIPITRLNMWYSQSDAELDLGFAQEFLENDSNFKVILFQIDRENTQYDDIYGESERQEVRFHPPVELLVSALKILPAEQKAYGSSNGAFTYADRGNLEFAVMTDTLRQVAGDLKRGDFVGYAFSEDSLQYWTVTNDGRMNMDNEHTLYGIKPYFRSIVCVPADPNQFDGL